MIFPVTVHAASGIQNLWEGSSQADENQKLRVSIPPEFSGPGGGLSPEDIYGLALANCFVATFKVFAEKSNLSYRDIKIEADLVVDRDEKGIPWMSEIKMKIYLFEPNVPEKAQRLLEKTATSCMILNSVKTKKSFEFFLAD